jgi:ASC-1-like (ASCH) protein
LFDFYVESIKSGKNIEAALTFDKLRKLEAFIFVQQEEIDTHLVQERAEFEKPIT